MSKELDIEKLRYPIGKFEKPEKITETKLKSWLNDWSSFPSRLTKTVSSLTDDQLNWRYRPDGWTIKQVVHHCADSHLNSYIRFKFSLTEDTPTIKPYDEAHWANLPDANDTFLEDSIKILEGVHARLTTLIRSTNRNDLKKGFFHPEHEMIFPLDVTLALYAWHSNHHLAHIKQAVAYEGKY